MLFSEGDATFKSASRTGIRQETLKIVIEKGLWTIQGFCKTIRRSPLTNVKWHYVTWPYTMTTPYWSNFVPNSTFYRILRGFRRTFATGVACRQGTFWTPSPVYLGLAYVLLVETNPFPNFSLFFRIMFLEYPSALSRFCFVQNLWPFSFIIHTENRFFVSTKFCGLELPRKPRKLFPNEH